ncbi:RHO1 GDP-GTP exchange protein 2 [Irineochytrium annulatum]|nr:RHO1 GDP-GTP exchange protein 2 [Irineochytrium annulatum]
MGSAKTQRFNYMGAAILDREAGARRSYNYFPGADGAVISNPELHPSDKAMPRPARWIPPVHVTEDYHDARSEGPGTPSSDTSSSTPSARPLSGVMDFQDQWWQDLVPASLLSSVSELEVSRQNAILELIKNQRNFCADLHLLSAAYHALLHALVLPRESLDTIFCGGGVVLAELVSLNDGILAALEGRQTAGNGLVRDVADVFLGGGSQRGGVDESLFAKVYPVYGGAREDAKEELEEVLKVESVKESFERVLGEVTVAPLVPAGERNSSLFDNRMSWPGTAPSSKDPAGLVGAVTEPSHGRWVGGVSNLGLMMHKPLSRLASYGLLLGAVLKKTEDAHEQDRLKLALAMLDGVLQAVDSEVGRRRLLRLERRLGPAEVARTLNLNASGRDLLYSGDLEMAGKSGLAKVTVFIFDHFVVMTKKIVDAKGAGRGTRYDIVKKPIPLDLLILSTTDELSPVAATFSAVPPNSISKSSSTLSSMASSMADNEVAASSPTVSKYPNAFYLYHNHPTESMTYTLSAATPALQSNWLKNLQAALKKREGRRPFEIVPLTTDMVKRGRDAGVVSTWKFEGRLIMATREAVFVADPRSDSMREIMRLPGIKQCAVLRDVDLFLVLSETALLSFYLPHVIQQSNFTSHLKGKRLCKDVTFFEVGTCLDRTMICAVTLQRGRSKIKLLDFTHRRKGFLSTLVPGSSSGNPKGDDVTSREFYIPADIFGINFLKSKIVVACDKGFEVLDMKKAYYHPHLIGISDRLIEVHNLSTGDVEQLLVGDGQEVTFSSAGEYCHVVKGAGGGRESWASGLDVKNVGSIDLTPLLCDGSFATAIDPQNSMNSSREQPRNTRVDDNTVPYAPIKARRKTGCPFFVLVLVEVVIFCASITVALVWVAYRATANNDNMSLSTSETSVQDLAFDLQTKLSQLVVKDVADVTSTPTLLLTQTITMIALGHLMPYMYAQIQNVDSVSFVLWGSNVSQNAAVIGKINSQRPYHYQALIQENHQQDATNPYSQCPLLCPQNMTPGNLYFWNLDAYGKFDKASKPIQAVPFVTHQRPWYTDAIANRTSIQWSSVHTFTTVEHDVGVSAVSALQFGSQAVIGSDNNLIGVAGVDISFAVISANLKSLNHTANGFSLIFDARSKSLMGTSVASENISIVTTSPTGAVSAVPKDMANLTDSSSTIVANTLLEACAGDLTALPPNGTYYVGGLIFQHMMYTDPYGLNMIIVSGAPLNDYIGPFELTRLALRDNLYRAEIAMIVVASSLCLAFVLISIPTTFLLIGRPLNRLSSSMVDVSKFDFSSLQGVNRESRSFIKELALIEDSYWNMITKFAMGIKSNKRLVNGGSRDPDRYTSASRQHWSNSGSSDAFKIGSGYEF